MEKTEVGQPRRRERETNMVNAVQPGHGKAQTCVRDEFWESLASRTWSRRAFRRFFREDTWAWVNLLIFVTCDTSTSTCQLGRHMRYSMHVPMAFVTGPT